MRQFILLTSKHPCINLKNHYALKYFSDNYKTVQCDVSQLETFFNANNSSDTLIVFYTESILNSDFEAQMASLLSDTLFLFKFVYFSFDYWNLNNPMFAAKNHMVISFACPKKLSFYRNSDYTQYAHNIITYNIWCCYKESILPFNESPELKLAISGNIHRRVYPERYILHKIKSRYIHHLHYDTSPTAEHYGTRLNRYFAGFASCVHMTPDKHIKDPNKRTYYRSHTILQKTFEILGAGALLVMPDTEKNALEEIGLIHDVHCYLISMDNILRDIRHIFTNVAKYTSIRKYGQEFAKLHFNEDIKIREIRNFIE